MDGQSPLSIRHIRESSALETQPVGQMSLPEIL